MLELLYVAFLTLLLVMIATSDASVDWLIERAKRTPYFHLDGYMERYWLVPYNTVIERRTACEFHGTVDCGTIRTDGTGPVTGQRPIAKLLQLCNIAIRIHHILRSDHGRDPHDHPWPYVTIILKGGYYEVRFDADGKAINSRWHGAGSILVRRAGSLHKLIVPKDQTAWTLFITGKKCQTWGFKPKDAPKIPYYEYDGEV